MKKAIIAFTVLLVLSLISTICFAAATGTKVIKSAVEYLAENDIRNINDIDKLGDAFEEFVRDKLGKDLDIHISFNDDENLEKVVVDDTLIEFDEDEQLKEIEIGGEESTEEPTKTPESTAEEPVSE